MVPFGLREVFKKLRRENLRPKNATGGGGGGQRCQKDTTVPTKSDFNAVSTKNSRISTIFWHTFTFISMLSIQYNEFAEKLR